MVEWVWNRPAGSLRALAEVPPLCGSALGCVFLCGRVRLRTAWYSLVVYIFSDFLLTRCRFLRIL